MAKAKLDRSAFMLPAGHHLHSVQRIALIVGIVAAGLTAFGAMSNPVQFFRSYLVAYLYCLALGLGSLGILLLHHVVGGRWGSILRKFLEAGSRTLPMLALAFVPLLFGMHELYEWSHADAVAHDPVIAHKSLYLNSTFFTVRAAVYFLVWITLATLASRWSAAQEEGGGPAVNKRLEFLGRGGTILYAGTMTFAAIDWVMSIDVHWFSHIYGLIFVAGQVLTAMAFMVVVASSFAGRAPFERIMCADRFHDLGKLMLAFIMVWAYFALSQYLIIWSGNLPEETPWYISRLSGGWEHFGSALIIFHFVLPFVVLLSRDVKRNPRSLALVACALLVFRYMDLYWLVVPSFSPGVFTLHWLDFSAMAALGGLWIALFVQQIKGHTLLPLGDPMLAPELAEGAES